MNKWKKLLWILGLVVIIFSVWGCDDDDTRDNARVQVNLKSTPAPRYSAINIDISHVKIHIVPSSNGIGEWRELPTKSGIYNLLTLLNGNVATIVDMTGIPAGKIDQMRLVLGTRNTIVVNGTTHDLSVPSGQESGIKLMGPIIVSKDARIIILINFDASSSVVVTGSGTYQLKPVIQAE